MNEQAKPQCGNCRFFRQEMKNEKARMELVKREMGMCHRYAPEYVLDNKRRHAARAQFPVVKAMMWCGDHEPVTK